jgi:hypothetical protein
MTWKFALKENTVNFETTGLSTSRGPPHERRYKGEAGRVSCAHRCSHGQDLATGHRMICRRIFGVYVWTVV